MSPSSPTLAAQLKPSGHSPPVYRQDYGEYSVAFHGQPSAAAKNGGPSDGHVLLQYEPSRRNPGPLLAGEVKTPSRRPHRRDRSASAHIQGTALVSVSNGGPHHARRRSAASIGSISETDTDDGWECVPEHGELDREDFDEQEAVLTGQLDAGVVKDHFGTVSSAWPPY